MTDITAAARATRRYIVDTDSDGTFYISGPKGDIPGSFDEYPEAQAACDRMNLQAVLEAIREPSEEQIVAGSPVSEAGVEPDVYTAMIDALIAEAAGTDGGTE